jgi:lipopolysaccharide export system permease protein
VFGTILHRMILWELTKVFLMSLLGITGIMLLAGIVAEASQYGLGPAQILAVIPLVIPSTLPYTIPATTLFATCLVYGRLAHDNEILAIKASGINVMKVVAPGLMLGLVMSGVTMGLYYRIIPYTHHLLRSLPLRDVEGLLYTLLQRQNQLNHPQLHCSMYIKGMQGRTLLGPTFMRRNQDGKLDVVADAHEAELHVDMARRVLIVAMRWGTACGNNGTNVSFVKKEWEVELPENLLGDTNRRPRDLTWQEMLQQRRDLEGEAERIKTEIAMTVAPEVMSHAPPLLHRHVDNLRGKLGAIRTKVLALNAEFHMRPALSLGCLCFILVGCPIGIWFSRSDYLSSFITCFLPIVFLYYPLLLCGTGIAKDGTMSPAVSVWAANVLMTLMGLVLFHRLLKH